MPLPFFSIVIPTHGRKAALKNCLLALKEQDYPSARFEIIVVFDGEEVQDLPDLEPLSLQIVGQLRQGPAAARNFGAGMAKGDFLAFTDDDCLPATDWLFRLSAVIQQSPNKMVGGKIRNALSDNPYAAASQLLVDYLYERHNSDSSRSPFLASNNMTLPRNLFLEIGGFDAGFTLAAGEDREFCHRWLRQGHEIHYEPKALIYHAHDLTFLTFWRQHLNYGRGAYHYHQKTGQTQPRQLPHSLSFYVNLLLFPLRRATNKKIKLLLLFGLMQLATTCGYFKAYRTNRAR